MVDISEESATSFFTKFAQHKMTAHNNKHAQWVMFRHGSLYIQTMRNNVETPENELIQLAQESCYRVNRGDDISYDIIPRSPLSK